MKILIILGARPQFIKAASFNRGIRKHNNIEGIIVHTEQQYGTHMSDIFYDEMKLSGLS